MRGVTRAPLRSALCAATSGVSLAVLCAFLVLYTNVEGALAGFGAQLDMSVYLQEGTDAGTTDRVGAWLRARAEVAEVRYVDVATVAERLRTEHPEHAALWGDPRDLPLERSFEVRLTAASNLRERLAGLAEEVRAVPGVAAADYGAGELRRVEGALDLLRSVGVVLAIILALAAMFVIGATVRLAIRDRRDELEIMRLCGATNAFIRAPLYLEGALQGLLGGGLALGLAALLHALLETSLPAFLPDGGSLQLAFLSTDAVLSVIAGAALLGAAGSALAASRYLRA
jgi:cell division transport system permease protein